MFENVQEATGKAIAAILGLQIAASLLVNAFVFQGTVLQWLGRAVLATKGLVHPDLIANLVPLVLVVGVGIFGIAGLRPQDLGATRASLLPALGATVAFWLGLQVAFGLSSLRQGGLAWYPAWREPGAGYVLGGLLGQLFGNALAEEALFRGFLFPQFLLKMRKKWSRRQAAFLAALASQVVFALFHIPNYLFVRHERFLVMDLVRLVINGVILLLVYLAAQNLLVAVGVHALWNTPTPLFAPPSGFARYGIVVGCTLALAGAWYLWRKRPLRGQEEGQRPRK